VQEKNKLWVKKLAGSVKRTLLRRFFRRIFTKRLLENGFFQFLQPHGKPNLNGFSILVTSCFNSHSLMAQFSQPHGKPNLSGFSILTGGYIHLKQGILLVF